MDDRDLYGILVTIGAIILLLIARGFASHVEKDRQYRRELHERHGKGASGNK